MSEQKAINQKEIDATHALFEKAEANLKRAEHLTNEVFIPAVNELRYAGYHLFAYLSSNGIEDDLISAKKHCKRAIYDAAEGPLLKLLGDIQQFQTDYAKVSVTPEVPDYINHLKKAQEAKNLIEKIQPNTREAYFEAVEPHLETLNEIVNFLETARPEINKRMRNEQRNTGLVAVACIAGILAAIFAATGPVFSSESVAKSGNEVIVKDTTTKGEVLPASGVASPCGRN